MKNAEISQILDRWQRNINLRQEIYSSLLPYPHCAVCYCTLNVQNVTVDGDMLEDVCKPCLAFENGTASRIQHQNCDCIDCVSLPEDE